MKRKLAVLLTAATVFSAILPTTCMASREKRQTFREGTTISFWHAMGGVNGEALDYLVNKFNEENEIWN